jgi:hypothetical protein
MNITDDKKVDVLLSALEERYRSIHEIRNRLQNVSIWSLGIMLAASGWLFQSDVYLFKHEQIILLAVLASLITILFKTYIKDLEKGFRNQQRVTADIESALGFFEDNILTEKALYPSKWRNSGTDIGEGKYFNTTGILILSGGAVLALTILIKGCLLF